MIGRIRGKGEKKRTGVMEVDSAVDGTSEKAEL